MSGAPAQIRSAELSDLPSLVRIYNHYVETTHVTFDTKPFGVEERGPWFEDFRETGPHRLLVATVDAAVAGYASSSRFRPKPAYDRSVETTVYLDPGFTGRGTGALLYARLLALLEQEPGVHRAYGGVALPNDASARLHERLGFSERGTFREVGFKFGRYWDVRWYERDMKP